MGCAVVTGGFVSMRGYPSVTRVSPPPVRLCRPWVSRRPWGSLPSGGFATLNGSTKIVTILLSEKCYYLAEHLIPDLGVHDKGSFHGRAPDPDLGIHEKGSFHGQTPDLDLGIHEKGSFHGQTPDPDLGIHEKGSFHGRAEIEDHLRHARMPLRYLWARSPCRRPVRRPPRHAGMPLRYLWVGWPWRRDDR